MSKLEAFLLMLQNLEAQLRILHDSMDNYYNIDDDIEYKIRQAKEYVDTAVDCIDRARQDVVGAIDYTM